MRRPGMKVVKKNREMISQGWIHRNCRVKELLLHIARQIGPKLKGRTAKQQFQLIRASAHMTILDIKLSPQQPTRGIGSTLLTPRGWLAAGVVEKASA
jgi:hypothetical protein